MRRRRRLPRVFDFFGDPSSALGRFLGRFGREDSPSPELLGACKSSDQLKAKGRLLSVLDRARDLPERREGDRVSSVFPESWRGLLDFRFSNLESSDFPEPWRGLRDFRFLNLESSDFPESWRGLRDLRDSNLESSALRLPEPVREDRVRPEFLELRRSEEFWLLRRCRRVGSGIRIPSKPSMVRRSIATPSFRSMSSMVRRSSSDTKV